MTETTKPARLIQSPALIVTGSSVLITDKGARVATFALMTCVEFLGAERDLRTGAALLPWAILQPPQPDGRCSQMPNPPAVRTMTDSSISGIAPKRIADGNRGSRQRRDCCQYCCQAAGQGASHADSCGISVQYTDYNGR